MKSKYIFFYLILDDLGYYSLDFFEYIMKKKAYFVSKLKLNSTKTSTKKGTKINFKSLSKIF